MRVICCVLLFFFVFGLRQIINVLIYVHLPPEWLQRFINLVFQIVSLTAVLLLMKWENSRLQEHGFWLPEEDFGRYLFVSMLFALAYMFITVFLQGIFLGFELYPPVPQPFLEIADILLTSIATESIFRGYIQRNLTRVYGFLPALSLSSVLFSIYGVSLPSLLFSFDLTFLLVTIVSLFVASIFLGFFFQKTMTLVCPVAFYGFHLFLYRFTTVKVITTEFMAVFFDVIAYIFLILLVYTLERKKFWELEETIT